MDNKLKEGQTLMVLDKEDIAFVVKANGSHEVFISSEIDEDAETEQNFTAVLILAVLSNPQKYSELTLKILEEETAEDVAK